MDNRHCHRPFNDRDKICYCSMLIPVSVHSIHPGTKVPMLRLSLNYGGYIEFGMKLHKFTYVTELEDSASDEGLSERGILMLRSSRTWRWVVLSFGGNRCLHLQGRTVRIVGIYTEGENTFLRHVRNLSTRRHIMEVRNLEESMLDLRVSGRWLWTVLSFWT
jgi:hypothetical protein